MEFSLFLLLRRRNIFCFLKTAVSSNKVVKMQCPGLAPTLIFFMTAALSVEVSPADLLRSARLNLCCFFLDKSATLVVGLRKTYVKNRTRDEIGFFPLGSKDSS